MDVLRQDVLHALRFLRQRPLFTLVSAASIAIGAGATTAVFSFANALLIRPPAGITGIDRVVDVGRTRGGRGFDTFSYAELGDLRAGATPPFEALAGHRYQIVSRASGGAAEQVLAAAVSQPYFDIMGVKPAAGRFFRPDEDVTPGAHPVAVVSWRFWQDRLGGTLDVVGRTLDVNRREFTIIGVTAAAFRGHTIGVAPDVWVPLTMFGALRPGFDAFDDPRSSFLTIVGRLQPGATLAQADAAVALVMQRREPPREDARNVRSATVAPLGALPAPARPIVRAFLGALGGLVVIVLLVTCANVAGMLLARGAAREREIAIRLAIGSGRARLLRQLVFESVGVFLLGGCAGVALAAVLTRLAAAIPLPVPFPVEFDATPDALVLMTGLGVSLLTGVLFGLAPALQAGRTDIAATLKSDARRRGARGGRARRAFVVAQVGLSLVLLLAAGLFLRALQQASDVAVGFDPAGVRMVGFDLSMAGYDEARGTRLLEELRTRVLDLPGVTGAGFASELPLDLGRNAGPVYPEAAAPADSPEPLSSDVADIGPGYFEAVGIRVSRGRAFSPADRAGAPPVVIVSRTLAERVWPGVDPIGQRLRFGDPAGTLRTVVGVADDVKNATLMETPEPMLWLPVLQRYVPALTLLVRSDGDGAALASALRTTILDADPGLALSPVQSFEAYTSIGLLPQRLAAGATGGLGLLALLLSAVGIYGVIAFAVTQRTREIAVRMALGAQGRDVVALFVRDGLRLVTPGLAAGLVGGLGLGFVIRGFILGVAPADPVAFLFAPALLLAAVLLASAGPARRAARVPPATALRSE